MRLPFVTHPVLGLLLLLGGQAMADGGVVSYIKLNTDTADADSGIDAANFYTHLLDFGTGSAATVNAVPFTQVTLANVDSTAGFSYAVDSSGRNEHAGNAGHNVTGDIVELLSDFIYNGNNAPGGVATITVFGLAPGVEYDTRIYNRQWDTGTERTATFEFDTDALPGAEDTIASIDQNHADLTPPSDGTYADNTAYALSYRFIAESDTMTVSINQANSNQSWHVYGVTNEELGVTELAWDGLGDGNWDSATQWVGGDPGDTPDMHTNTTVQNNIVTVTSDATARMLVVDSGGIAVADGGSLTIRTILNSAGPIALGANAQLIVGGGALDSLTTAGDAVLGASGSLDVETYADGGVAGTLTKQGDGAVTLNNVTAADTQLQISGGTLSATGADGLGGMTGVTLDGGALNIKGDAVVTPNVLSGLFYDVPTGVPSTIEPIDSGSGVLTQDPGWTEALTGPLSFGDNTLQGYAGVPEEDYVGAWRGQIVVGGPNLPAGDVSIAMSSDDGNVFYIDLDGNGDFQGAGELIVADNADHGFRSVAGSVNLAAGTYEFVTAFYERGGGDGMTVQFGAGADLPYDDPGMKIIDPTDPTQDGIWSGVAIAAIDASDVSVTVTNDSTLNVRTDFEAAFGPLTMVNGSLTTSGAKGGMSFAGTTIDAAATAVGFDPQVTTDYGTITNNSAQPTLVISKAGPGELRLNAPLSGTTDNIRWNVADGSLIARGEDTLSGRPITVAGGTLDLIGETSLGGAAIELAGGTLRVEGIPGTSVPGPAGAIAHYAFDTVTDGATSNDGSAGSVLDGVLSGNATLTADGGGAIGEAMRFSGGDYVDIAFDGSLEITEYTVSAWVNIASEPGNYGILGTRFGGDTTFDVKVRANDVHGDIGSGGGWIDTNVDIRAQDIGSNLQGGDLGIGEWHMVTYAIDGPAQQCRLYLDADLKRTIDYSGAALLMQPGQSMRIGNAAGSEYMDGLIDDVYVYGRALSDQDVVDLWGNGFGPNDGTSGLDMSNTDLVVSADSTLYAAHPAPGGGSAPFGALTVDNGVLTTAGTPAGVAFASTTIDSGATAVGFRTDTATNLGPIDVQAADLSIAKSGQGDLILDQVSTGLDTATFDVQQGRLVAVGGADALSSATLQLGGGEVVLASKTAGADVVYDNPVVVEANGILTAGTGDVGQPGPLTVTLGGNHGVTINNGTLTLQAVDDYSLDVAGPLGGSGALRVEQGSVTLSAGGDVASITVADGALDIGAELNVQSMTIRGGTVDTGANQVVVSNTLRLGDVPIVIDAGNTFTAKGPDLLAGANVTLAGGAVSIGSDAGLAPIGIVAYYSFDEEIGGVLPNEGPAGSVLDGTINGDAMLTTADGGRIREAMLFDGNGDFVDIGFDESLQVTDYTVSAWVNLASKPTNAGILGTRFGSDTTFDFKVRPDDIHGDIGTGGGWINTDVDIRAGDVGSNDQGGVLDVDQWYMVTYVIDDANQQVRLYLDADLKRTIDYSGAALLMQPGQSMRIGTSSGTEYMDGLIDELYVYERALSDEEVAELHNLDEAGGGGVLDVPNLDLTVSDDSILQLNTDDDAVLGNLTLAAGKELSIVRAAASFGGVTAGDGSSIVAESVLLRGTLTTDGPGQLTLNGEIEFEDDAVYLAQLGDGANSLVSSTADAFVGGTLTLEAVANLGAVGDYSGAILEVTGGEAEVLGAFENEPAAGEHLGHGVFHRGITYSELGTSVDVDVFQAAAGDTNADRQVDNSDLQQILGAGSFGNPGDWDWPQGDFNGDQSVNNSDLQLILATGLFGGGTYAALAGGAGPAAVPEPGTLALLACGVAGLLLAVRRRRR